MKRDTYLIVRIDWVLVPAVVAWVGHGETPHDLNLRFTNFRGSATEWSSKRDAIKEAKRLAKSFPGYQFKVNQTAGRRTVWTNREVTV